MLDRLPELIDPLSFADKRSELVGHIALSGFDRLAEVLMDNTGTVSVNLIFGREGNLATIEGRITATLAIQCQNCLQVMLWPVDSKVKLGIVTSLEEADRLPEDCEPLLVGHKKIPLKDVVEDELLLSLPAFPKHSEPCFQRSAAVSEVHESLSNEQSNLNNPFSILAKLKNTGDK
ncbi:MAG: YceD family protein [Gammaproteobacteria bacterium]